MQFLNSESVTVLIPTFIIVFCRNEVRKLTEDLTFSIIKKV